MKNVVVKTAKADALKSAVAGSADRALNMRAKAEDIKNLIMEDVRAFPSDPHLWSRVTREVRHQPRFAKLVRGRECRV